MFYEKLAQAKQENKRGERNRLDDLGFNVGVGMLAHKGLKRGLGASAFEDGTEIDRAAGGARKAMGIERNTFAGEMLSDKSRKTGVHNPLTRVVDSISGAKDMDVIRKSRFSRADELYKQYTAGGSVSPDLLKGSTEQKRLGEEMTKKLRKRRLLGRRVAHGVGLGATLLAANKLRNMYNARKQERN